MVAIYPRVSQTYTPHRSVCLYYCFASVRPLHPVHLDHPCSSVHPLSLGLVPTYVVVVVVVVVMVVAVVVVAVVRTGFSHHNSSLALCAKHTSRLPNHITLYLKSKQHKNNIYPKQKEPQNCCGFSLSGGICT